MGETFNQLFKGCNQRLIVTTFASNVHRIQQIIEAAAKVGRKVAISGRSMENILKISMELGYISAPKNMLIDISQIGGVPKNKLVIVTTGSQGETMSALYRMAFGTHKQVEIGGSDRVIISASPIPGNEKMISRVINELFRRGADVVYERLSALHVSGHACQEELKIMLGLCRPKYFMPIHGEYKHLRIHAKLAEKMGIPPKNIFISENGKVLEFTENGAKFAGKVNAGQIMIDGSMPGDVGGVVMRDRRTLAEDGIIMVAMALSSESGEMLSGPEIISRGFVYMKDSENLISELSDVAYDAFMHCKRGKGDWSAIKSSVKSRVSDYIYRNTKRRPMVLPVIMEV